MLVQEASVPSSDAPSDLDETSKYEVSNPVPLVDYSNMFGEEFQLPDDFWDSSILSILDVGAVEEGILHVLYACASQVDFISIGNIMFLKHCTFVMSISVRFLIHLHRNFLFFTAPSLQQISREYC